MKQFKRILILACTFFFALACIRVNAFAANDEEDKKDVANSSVKVELECGLDKVCISNKPTPITIKVNNAGEDFQGTLRVIIPEGSYQHSIAHEKTLTVPKGGEKSVSLLLSNISDAQNLRVELETEKGKIIYSERIPVKTSDCSKNAVVGVLSSDFSALNYLDGITLDTVNGTISTRVIKLTADNIPEVSDGLEICNFIIIDNYNTTQLSEKQREAISGWVSNGGVLIFGTGAKASTTLEGFQGSMFDVQVGSISKETMQVYNAKTTDTKDVDIVSLTANGWEVLTEDVSYTCPTYRQAYGNGVVAILTYDLGMEPLVSWWEANDALGASILQDVGYSQNYEFVQTYYNNTFDVDYNIEQALDAVDGNKSPSALLYGFIFLSYILLIGPIMYVILRAKDKREWMWLIMPLITLTFTIIVYATSMFYRIHKPFVDEIAFLDYSSNSVKTTSYMTVQSPKSAAYEVEFGDGYTSVAACGEGYTSVPNGSTDYRHAIGYDGDNLVLRMKRGTAFEEQNMLATKTDALSAEGFVLNLKFNTINSIEGDVTNNTGYKLKNVVVCYGSNAFVYLGDMENGDTIQIDPSNVESYVGYDADEWMGSTTQISYLSSRKTREDYINEQVYLYLVDRYNNNQTGQGMVFGMIDGYDSTLVKSKSISKYSAGCAISNFFCLPEEYQKYSYYIDDINDYAVGAGRNVEYSDKYPDDIDLFYDADTPYMSDADLEVLYDFSGINTEGAFLLCDTVHNSGSTEDPYYGLDMYTYDYDEDVEDDEAYMVESWASVEAYNWTEGRYEQIFIEPSDTEAIDLAPYLDEHQWLKLRYTCDMPDDYYSVRRPQLTMIGGAR